MIIGASGQPAIPPLEPMTPLEPTIADREPPRIDVSGGELRVRLAASPADVDAVQALRYRIFYETMGAKALPEMARRRRDSDPFDDICDHLMVLDHTRGSGADAVVGTYRLIRREAARR